jgi:hypothetical protein
MKKTSKFFATGDESSEEDERSEHESEEEQQKVIKCYTISRISSGNNFYSKCFF